MRSKTGLPRNDRPTDDRIEHDPEKWVPVFRKDHASYVLGAITGGSLYALLRKSVRESPLGGTR
jgi:hypothetical protein